MTQEPLPKVPRPGADPHGVTIPAPTPEKIDIPNPWSPQKAGQLREALDLLAEELAWKLNHPMSFSSSARDAFDCYVAIVGTENLSEEVKAAMRI